jgi:WD40 repeat protein
VATGKIVHTLEGTTRTVHAVAVAPDGKTFAAGGGGPRRVLPGLDTDTSEVRLWDLASGRLIWTAEGDWNSISGLSFTPDGRTLLYSDAQVIGLIDVGTGKIVRTLRENPVFTPRR